jgi:hypothetical protein
VVRGSARVRGAGERVLAIADFGGSSLHTGDHEGYTKIRFGTTPLLRMRSNGQGFPTSTPEACASLLHLSEPAQSDRSLSVIHFVPAMESPDSHSIETSSLN